MFRTNIPVSATGFFGRDEEIARLMDLAADLQKGNPRWLAILGSRKIGKTSLLLELRRRLSSPSIRMVVFDTFEAEPVGPDVFRHVALRLLDSVISEEIGLSLEAILPAASEFRATLQQSDSFSALPAAARSTILELPESAPTTESIRAWLDLPEVVAAALGLHVVVAWDEFQALSALSRGRNRLDPFGLMRAVWQRHQRVAYVISGSERTMLTELVADRESPFFQHFDILELGALSRPEAVRLLIESAPRDRPVPMDIAEAAVDLLARHPFYLQLYGDALTRGAPPYDKSAMKRTIQDLLFSRTGRLALYFEGRFRDLAGRSINLSAVLDALAAGPIRPADLASRIGAASGATARYVDRLGDAVTRTADGRYQLADPVFGLWLGWRRPGGAVIPMSVVGDEAERRVAVHLARMGFELVYQSRASRGAFDLLAIRGDIQLGVQVKRSDLPLRFDKGSWDRMEDDARRFEWRWIVAAVSPEDRVLLLDPGRAERGGQIRVTNDALIENLLSWLAE